MSNEEIPAGERGKRTWQVLRVPGKDGAVAWLAGDIAMTIDTDRIDDAVLALLHLTLHDQNRASKGFDGDALGRLNQKGMIDGLADEKSVTLTDDGLQRSKKLFEAMFTRQAEGQSRYPHVKVDLSDLDGQLWPILRRVSYAMSDADVNEADIEQYKVEVRAGGDPIAVSSRWVQVERRPE